MKRYLLLSLCLLAGIAAVANPITREQARQKAEAFMAGKHIAADSKNGMRKAPRMTAVTQTNDTEAYYVFNAEDNGGFVIVSGDDQIPEILGYSDAGNFDAENQPPALAWWLKSYYVCSR